MDEVDYSENKNLCLLEEPMRGVRRQLADWEEIFTTHLSKTGLISALRKNFK